MMCQMSSRRANKGPFHMFIWGECHRPQHTGTHWSVSMKTERHCLFHLHWGAEKASVHFKFTQRLLIGRITRQHVMLAGTTTKWHKVKLFEHTHISLMKIEIKNRIHPVRRKDQSMSLLKGKTIQKILNPTQQFHGPGWTCYYCLWTQGTQVCDNDGSQSKQSLKTHSYTHTDAHSSRVWRNSTLD